MKKNEIGKEEHKVQKIMIPNNINERNRFFFNNRQNSVRNFYKQKKNEKIVPLKRNIKSREKEIKRIPNLPLIKKNSFKSKSKINNIPKPTINIKTKEIHKEKLPNIIINKKLNDNKNINIINSKIDNNNTKKSEIDEDCKNSELNQNKEAEKINNVNIEGVIKFYEEFIELTISLPNKNLYVSLINNFNKKYLLHYTSNTAINQIDDIKFNECLKYSFVVIACLVFVSKDEGNHKFTNQRLKELLDQFIFISLKKIKINSSTKIKTFINRMKPTKKGLYNSINAIIKLLFNNRNEYNLLKNAFNKIISNINTLSLNDISNILNNSILYCFNYQNNKAPILLKNNVSNNKKNNNKRLSKNKNEQNNNNNKMDELIPTPPFIKTEMTQKFCLVLDIDETITHTLKLPIGDFFLVRPGVKEFLEEMKKYFEIVIFTSSPKSYADNILDKIDINNEYFSYRLYRRHVCYENGNSVKKLNMIGRDLKKIVFVDNLKSNAKYNPNNLYHIKSWYNDILDNQLILLKDKLKDIATSGKYDDDITKGILNL